MIQDIAADWAVGGAETIARVRMTDPATYFRVVASILPKDVLVNVQQQTPGNLEPDEWRVLVDLVRLITGECTSGGDGSAVGYCAGIGRENRRRRVVLSLAASSVAPMPILDEARQPDPVGVGGGTKSK